MSGKLTVMLLLLVAICLPIFAWLSPYLAPSRQKHVDVVKYMSSIYPGTRAFWEKWQDTDSVLVEVWHPNSDPKYKKIMPQTSIFAIISKNPERGGGKTIQRGIHEMRNFPQNGVPGFLSASTLKSNISELKKLPSFSKFFYIYHESKKDFLGAYCFTPVKYTDDPNNQNSGCTLYGNRSGYLYSYTYTGPVFDFDAIRAYGFMIQSRLEKMGEIPAKN